MANMQEYQFYSDVAKRLFDYMNGKVNVFNYPCYLEFGWDCTQIIYGLMRFPNTVVLYLDNLLNNWDPEYMVDRDIFMNSQIAWAIAHELSHADQRMRITRYNIDQLYMDDMEEEVQRHSYDFCANNEEEILEATGVLIDMSIISKPNLVDNYNFEQMPLNIFYWNIIEGVILRSQDTMKKLHSFKREEEIDDLILEFISSREDGDRAIVKIKSNGKYLRHKINKFSTIVNRYTGSYSAYEIIVYEDYCKSNKGKLTCILTFIINNPIVYGIVRPR